MELQAYKGDKNLKDLLVKEIEKHRKADEIVKGSYGDADSKNFKGCAVGCSIYSLNKLLDKKYSTSDHSVYETALGIPEWLARLEDTIFEGLLATEAQLWPTKFSKAINVGADLNPIKWKFCAFVLKENIDRVLKLKISDELKEQVVKSIQGVLVLNENAIKIGEWDESAAESAARSAWSAAESAAESAARSAAESAWSAAESAESAARSAWSAAESAARSAARSAAESAWSAAESAESAARSAARSAAESAAKQKAYSKYAKYLLKLLKEVK